MPLSFEHARNFVHISSSKKHSLSSEELVITIGSLYLQTSMVYWIQATIGYTQIFLRVVCLLMVTMMVKTVERTGEYNQTEY